MHKSTELLSLVAAAFYIVTAILAVPAARSVQAARGTPHWHRTVWIVAVVLFVCCAASRLFGVEEGLRQLLRGELRDERLYAERREYQAMVASGIIIAGSIASMIGAAKVISSGVLRSSGLSRIALMAGLACAAMVILIVVRVVSLHALDVLLYRGPRLNWIVDIGATAMTGALAWLYAARTGHQRRR
ncbi:hypothetical protein HGI47_00760 [Novosphingobium sp. ERN07]|uniref:hypothetical protein n=1 Tax=Novosphingobium sp. ERN07 TaxID=2726187 RepID=UPI0014569603|nr:hypothetical protein [Novosphingobium sp. ERN07]NLR69404.1 hypothetical protein [Novosphingobium sp. ERN07]